MAVAEWNGQVIAEADKFEMCEGNVYFPPGSLKKQFFTSSDTHTTCGWKGLCSYYNVSVEGKENKDACWYYPVTKDAAKYVEGHFAFWKGVKVTKSKALVVDKAPTDAKC